MHKVGRSRLFGSLVFQQSLARARNLFDLKDRLRFANLSAIFTNDAEDLDGMV